MTLKPVETYGPVLAGRGSASRFRAQIEELAGRGAVVVDFEGITTVSPSFADELFAKLGRDLVARGDVRFDNLGVGVEAIARYVVAARHGALTDTATP
jgi:hypothetical protein